MFEGIGYLVCIVLTIILILDAVDAARDRSRDQPYDRRDRPWDER